MSAAAGVAARPPAFPEQRFSTLTAIIAWAMIVMMIVPGDLDYSFSADTSDGNPVTRTLWLLILAVSLVIIFLRGPLALRLVRRINIYYLLFLALAFTSVIWSIDPEMTVRRLVRLLIMCSAFLAVAVGGWNPRRFQQLIRPLVTLLLAGSIVFGLARPDLAIHHETNAELLNAWHGLAPTKNALGALASFGVILSLHAWLSRETGRLGALFGAAVGGACLILSRSQTSIMATVLTAAALLLLMRTPGSMRRSVPYLATGLIILILVYSMAMLRVIPGLEVLLSPIPMITGKDLTFSGRAEIWAVVVDHIKLRPVLGSGYAAYWTMGIPTPDMESYSVIAPLHGFYPGSCHNGYLQVLNDLGAVGLVILLGYLMVYFRQSIRLYAIDRTQGALFLALLLQQATINLSEPLWLNALLFEFVFMSLATTCMARALLETDAGGRPRSAQTRPRVANRIVRAPARRPFGARS
jgi:O-antigen ligase